ncbi:hypothetical protein N3K66_000742 [Trichothecium roseum]|uniref:Uncharacterized protein n=1 Tax=Trichothecium roseum TaxID=47278 RepID=A0ACC0VDM2_9HYPO|nr:hypothetical protein N3K66_000742 [Trichothecium roseum]
MHALPKPSAAFGEKKAQILEQLSRPEADYADLSPKGSVDVGIRDLIGEINGVDGFVTTSSCAGRVSVFVEGRRTADPTTTTTTATAEEEGEEERSGRRQQLATPGGKGGGGTWAFISHDPVPNDGAWIDTLQMEGDDDDNVDADEETSASDPDPADRRLIHFKFEPMILHVYTASPQHAQLILGCALQAGFRESGAINIASPPPRQGSVNEETTAATPMVGIRSMGLGFESLIGHLGKGGHRRRLELTVSRSHLDTLMAVANDRFAENARRIARFRRAFLDARRPRTNPDGLAWEDAAARRERKKAEGLRKRAELLEAGRTRTRKDRQTEDGLYPGREPDDDNDNDRL